MKEQQFTEEKPLLPEQRGVDSDMVSAIALFAVCVSSVPQPSCLGVHTLISVCRMNHFETLGALRQRCLCSLAVMAHN